MNTLPEDLELDIVDLARGGAGVAREASGRVIFVPLTMPGDRVRVRILESEKRFAQGEVLELLRPSPDRLSPPCPSFGWGPDRCGGCEWQHVPYALQWTTKVRGVCHALERAGVPAQVSQFEQLPAPEGERFGYRNRIQLRGRGSQIGFRARGSKTLVPIENCAIARPEINASLPEIRKRGEALERGRPEYPEYKVELEVTEAGEVRSYWNAKHAHGGFRQVHDAQNSRLQKWVSDRIPDGMRVLDLYGGSGNLSWGLAERSAEVHCVDLSRGEIPPSSPRFHWVRSDVARWLRGFRAPEAPTVAILDPPREGLSSDFAIIEQELARLKVQRLLLVGCDPDSWARDVSRFVKRGWKIQDLGVLDFFPQTPHVESLALLASS